MRKFCSRWWLTPEVLEKKWQDFLLSYPWSDDCGLSIRYRRGDFARVGDVFTMSVIYLEEPAR